MIKTLLVVCELWCCDTDNENDRCWNGVNAVHPFDVECCHNPPYHSWYRHRKKKTRRMEKPRLASKRMYLAAFSALTGAAASGCIICWSGTALTSMKKPSSVPHLNYNDQELGSWIGSCITLAALVGSIVCSFIVKFAGSRKTLIGVGLPTLIGWALIGCARSFPLVIIGRCITGFCVGIVTSCAPAYVSDIVTPSTRGFLGSCFQLILCVGQLFLITFGCFLEWNHLAWIGIIPAILCSAGMFFFGLESPFELVEDGLDEYAYQVLQLLRDETSDVDDELREMRMRVRQNQQMSATSGGFKILYRPDVWKPAVITIMLMMFQQFSGVNAVMFYLTDIFEQAGSKMSSGVCALLVSIALVAATLASGLVMDRFGRKLLLIISGAGHVITLFLMGIYYASIRPSASWIPVACLMLFVVFFSFGYGPIPWMIAGEITPSEAKPLVSSMGSTVNWFCAFLTTKFFGSMISLIHEQGAYWVFAVFSAFSIGYVHFMVPETKQKSIRDIQAYFLN